MLPLAATTSALLLFNWYPSDVFVGDTFTYFAGMAIAVAGILGHFSETLLILLIPQVDSSPLSILYFLEAKYSSTLIVAKWFVHAIRPEVCDILIMRAVVQVFNFVYSLPQLAKIVPCPRHRLPTFEPQSGLLYATPNWNLVNLVLHLLGPCSEQSLCIRLMVLQAACCSAAFGLRALLVGVYK